MLLLAWQEHYGMESSMRQGVQMELGWRGCVTSYGELGTTLTCSQRSQEEPSAWLQKKGS